jgi:uncharacterized delta-60 repeat protein
MKTSSCLFTLCSGALLIAQSYSAPGDIDATFGLSGQVTYAVGSQNNYARSTLLFPDGKLVAFGIAHNSSTVQPGWDFALRGLTSLGAIDTSFSGGAFTPRSFNSAAKLLRQPDGKILVVGGSGYDSQYLDCSIGRFLANGTLDTSFGNNGWMVTELAEAVKNTIEGAVLQPDGKIVVVGTVSSSFPSRIVVARFTANGAKDTTFGTNGEITTALRSYSNGRDIVLQKDGKLLVCGSASDTQPSTMDVALLRYLPDGSLDPTFGTGGSTILPVGTGEDYAARLALQPDGRIVVAGSVLGDTLFNSAFRDTMLLGFLNNGQLDPQFGNQGKVVYSASSGHDYCAGLAIQPNGKILLGCTASGVDGGSFLLLRFSQNGTLDTGFGEHGITKSFFPDGAGVADLTLQEDGKIVLSGHVNQGAPGYFNHFALRRYQGEPVLTNLSDWRQHYFQTTANGPDAHNLADPDHDGISNLQEYAFGSHPQIPSSEDAPRWLLSNGELSCQFRTPGTITQISYSAEWSQDLVDWVPLPDTGTQDAHRFSVAVPTSLARYVRLRVTEPTNVPSMR